MKNSDKFLETIEKYGMLDTGDTVLCCVSGGADSMALLCMFMDERERLGIQIRACHVNHMLRGDESERDRLFVEEFCFANKIPLDVLCVDVGAKAKEQGMSVELMAREVRYDYFGWIASKYGCKIATAHTLSDNTETVLFNLARGTGIRGLSGIPIVRSNIIRPLIMYERSEIEAYLFSRGTVYMEDSTNSQTVYNRNKIRHKVVPVLCEINSGAQSCISETAEQLYQINDFLKKFAMESMESCYVDGMYKLDILCGLHIAVRRQIILFSLEKNDLDVASRMIGQIDSIIMDKQGKINISNDWYAIVQKGFYQILHIQYPSSPDSFECEAKLGKTSVFNGKTVLMQCYEDGSHKNSENVHASQTKNMLDYDKIVGQMVYRSRIPGDKLKLAGRNVTKSLKKLFNEGKIPPNKRGSIVILCDEAGILWVENFGISQRVVCDGDTKRALKVEVIT